MCAECNEAVENSNTDKDLLLLLLAVVGGLVENYVEEGYSDPAMYKSLGIAKKISDKIGVQELSDRFATLQMEAGEIVEKTIAEKGLDISREDWS
jgi:hypothetical protein